MESFVGKHQKKINGTLGCFDRMLFRGYLPIQTGWAMAQVLNQNHIMFKNLKDFLTDSANRINKHAKAMADKFGRPIQYLAVATRKEELAQDGRRRRDPKRPRLYFLRVGTMPDIFPQVSKGRPVFGAGQKEMPVHLLLLHGPGIWSDTRKAANMVSHADSDLCEWT